MFGSVTVRTHRLLSWFKAGKLPFGYPNGLLAKIIQTVFIGIFIMVFCGEKRKTEKTTRVYGFNRAGQNISAAMNSAVENLIESSCVEEIEGKLRIKQ